MNSRQSKAFSSSLGRLAVSAALALGASVMSAPLHSAVVMIVLGSDYFTTVQPTLFTPAGVLNPFVGLPIGPGLTDTIVQRQGNCSLDLAIVGANCTIPIEMVALSLRSSVDPNFRIRESPTLASVGTMTMVSNGSGTNGTMTSFFDVFYELSMNGGATWVPQSTPEHLITGLPANWSTLIGPNDLAVVGPAGSQAANTHTGLLAGQADFYVKGTAQEQSLLAMHSVITTQIPEPGSLALLAAGLTMLGLSKRRNRVQA